MANFYSDKPELKFHLENDLMKRIVELREGDFPIVKLTIMHPLITTTP